MQNETTTTNIRLWEQPIQVPTGMDHPAGHLWQLYAELLAESLWEHGNIHLATEFYAARREAMDEGASIAWPERFNHDELSAVKHPDI